jgi:2-phosphosulfolactate phosphatase
MKLDVILTPAELPSLAKRDLSKTICVVFDILRATSAFVTALQNGAKEIIPVSEISEALALKKSRPDVLLGGERHGVKISADGIDFDFGNSPREYAKEKIAGKTIISTTTNGTRALCAVAKAKIVLAASFLNLSATAKFIGQQNCKNVLLVCAGTRDNPALEDILAAGGFCKLAASSRGDDRTARRTVPAFSDSAQIAFHAFENVKSNLVEAVFKSENAGRVMGIPELQGDVEFCLQRDIFPLVAAMNANGCIRRI